MFGFYLLCRAMAILAGVAAVAAIFIAVGALFVIIIPLALVVGLITGHRQNSRSNP
jgi:hypothetical protein